MGWVECTKKVKRKSQECSLGQVHSNTFFADTTFVFDFSSQAREARFTSQTVLYFIDFVRTFLHFEYNNTKGHTPLNELRMFC